jgi:catechol 2,3-dioxygenase-like lactoylglutathione lyase family enzyme
MLASSTIRRPRVHTSILNIVIGCPSGPWTERLGVDPPRALASFYAELLGLRVIREEWPRIAMDEDTFPRLAFDDPSDDPPPRWPDPEYPQQIHLDITVGDLEQAGDVALRGGATLLRDRGDFRTYADPAGHPFCLYSNPSRDGPRVRLERVVFDCFSPRALAAFYEALLGMPTRVVDSPERVEIAREDRALPNLAFQHDPRFKPPRWPDPAYPQQIHLDIDVDDPDAGRELVERLGAIRLPAMGGSCPVYADPSAHPFCLCGPGQ